MNSQPGILGPVPRHARYLQFSLPIDTDISLLCQRCTELVDGDQIVAGLGQPLLALLGGKSIETAPCYAGPGFAIPVWPAALWLWLRADDPGDIVQMALNVERELGGLLLVEDQTDGFMYRDSRDLTGYVDGTENPTGEEAVAAGIAADGSSSVAVQKWQHDLLAFHDYDESERDLIIGRRINDNEEIDDAPDTAHVKRSAQETYSPEAFMVRRSMPWADPSGEGLMFVAFGESFRAFDAVMRRMVGEEDGRTDRLFEFSRCLGTAWFWCPPMRDGLLVLE